MDELNVNHDQGHIISEWKCYKENVVFRVSSCNLTEVPTVFPSGDVHILAESGVSDSLEDLESSQDFDGIRG